MATSRPTIGHEFWEGRYQAGRTGWERGVPTPAFRRLLASDRAPVPGRVVVPGCGRGHDALLFAEAGHQVTGLDFAPSAIAGARELATAAGLADRVTFEVADVLGADVSVHVGQYDFAVERACYCALHPSDRERYVESVAKMLRPGGRLIGSFFVGPAEGGPPFAATWEEIEASLAPWFETETVGFALEETPLPGADLFAIVRKRT
ncbi:MAG: methyltransferase domain-containing protein [Chloroflexi bacterium]|jgi:SAM-dependent methyltransferase|nr:methyltransferase domain-containing protein [Chloroflexota bacterium]